MGIYHFMGMGASIGAVTCAVDYIEKCLQLVRDGNASEHVCNLFGGSGGINHHEADRGKIESIVLFSSDDVIKKHLAAYKYDGCENPEDARTEVERRLRKVWKTYDRDIGRRLIWCEVNVDDFRDCFKKARQVAQRFARTESQGKEIWCNLTSGTNSIGQALHSMASFTACSVKNYMISQKKDYRSKWQVPSDVNPDSVNDGYWCFTPYIKTLLDDDFYEMLNELETHPNGILTKELFSRIRNRGRYTNMDINEFCRTIALKHFGSGYTVYDSSQDIVSLSDAGRSFMMTEFHNYFEDGLRQSTQTDVEIIAEFNNYSWIEMVNL